MWQDFGISGYSDKYIDSSLDDHCKKVDGKDINTQKEVTVFKNECIYCIGVIPIFANGIPSDYMVGGVDVDYISDFDAYIAQHPEHVEAINKLLYTQANRKEDILAYLLCFYGSGLVVASPGKIALLLIDLGGGGKSTTHGLLLRSLRERYVFLIKCVIFLFVGSMF